jgi:diaminopimelate decarboxylase/aspartate kinase
VALPELEHILAAIPALDASGVLFTPNFAPRSEYAAALDLGVQVTIDNLHPLEQWPELFAGREVFLRVDLDLGHGHHKKVVTSGARSKFGISARQLKGLHEKLKALDITVTGLHAHTGSGVMDAGVWGEQLKRMLKLREQFPDVRVLDLGGGLGVPDRLGVPILDLALLNQRLAQVAKDAEVDVWLEPGRYLVAEAGVLLARVTQLKSKGEQHYLGLATGMNSLIRPALYGAYHRIVNLSRLVEKPSVRYTVVGPICESGDVLGESRMLPPAQEGDVVLIANAGAYGRVMASNYNRRAGAAELIIDS